MNVATPIQNVVTYERGETWVCLMSYSRTQVYTPTGTLNRLETDMHNFGRNACEGNHRTLEDTK